MTIAERLGRGKKVGPEAVDAEETYIRGKELFGSVESMGVGEWGGGRLRLPQGALVVLMLVLASSASFGLGMLADRAGKRPAGADDGFWIEKLAAAEPGLVATSSAAQPAALAESRAVTPTEPARMKQSGVPAPSTGAYLASKSGTSYYLPSCGGAKRIKEENKVWFASRAEAEAKGYRPAKNCKGL